MLTPPNPLKSLTIVAILAAGLTCFAAERPRTQMQAESFIPLMNKAKHRMQRFINKEISNDAPSDYRSAWEAVKRQTRVVYNAADWVIEQATRVSRGDESQERIEKFRESLHDFSMAIDEFNLLLEEANDS